MIRTIAAPAAGVAAVMGIGACSPDRRGADILRRSDERMAATVEAIPRAPTIEFGLGVPPAWADQRVSFVALAEEQRDAVRQPIEKALAKYPPRVLWRLQKILVVAELAIDGTRIGGTYSGRTVIISINRRGVSAAFIERAFHHEFASVLWRQDVRRFRVSEWMLHNDSPGFEYSGSGLEAIRSGRTRGNTWALYPRGFLSAYSMSTFSNDFSTVAEGLFTGEPALWDPKFPQLIEKRKLAISFYEGFAPSLSMDYFYELHRQRMDHLGLDPHPK
jgi:hypothetical protein